MPSPNKQTLTLVPKLASYIYFYNEPLSIAKKTLQTELAMKTLLRSEGKMKSGKSIERKGQIENSLVDFYYLYYLLKMMKFSLNSDIWSSRFLKRIFVSIGVILGQLFYDQALTNDR